MSVLDDATIIYVPGVYKTSAVALQKPISAGSVSSLTFARASSGTRVNSAGLIESVATNIPRIDFLNDTCGSQLLEPARTNLLLRSEEFDNAAWVKTTASITADATNAPDGTATADQVDKSASGGRLQQTVTFAGTTSFSVYAKAGTLDWIRLGRDAAEATYFDLVNGVVGTMGATSASIESLANGWYRCTIVFSFTGSNNVRIYPADGDGDVSGTSGNIFIWGAQVETGAYPSTYIKTEASTVTRAAETLSKTGLATELGDSEGTIYFEGSVFDADGAGFGITLSDGTLINRVFIGKNSSVSPIRAIVTVGGFAQFDNTGSNWVDNTDIKIALKYAANNFALWVNGVEVATDISGSTFTDGTLTRFGFDSSGLALFYGNVKQLAIWDRALTDTELEDLTT